MILIEGTIRWNQLEAIDLDEPPAMRIWGAKVDRMTWRYSDEINRWDLELS